MSFVTYNPGNRLPDDVLLVIFDQLDDQDLLRCETVCRQWRNVLLSGRPWKILFRRQIVSSRQWRRVLQDFGVNVDKLKTGHYRGLCRTIIQQLNKINRNWRTGIFEEIEEKCLNGGKIDNVENDCIVSISTTNTYSYEKKLLFLDRRSQRFTGSTIIPLGWSGVTNTEIVVLWERKNMEILDINGRLISEVQELDEDERISWNLASCSMSGHKMAVLSQTKSQEKLSLWDVSDPSKVTRLSSQYFDLGLKFGLDSSMKLDEQFIFISSIHKEKTRFYFFLKESLDLHWQKAVDGNIKNNFAYGKGLLLIYVSKQNDKSKKYGTIQVYDVKSRTFFRELRIKAKRDFEKLHHKVPSCPNLSN
jgi:F-box-like